MARGVNKVILIGNLGRDPEVRYTQNGSAVASFSIATTDSWKDKNTGENQERTEWHNIVVFSRLAEICGEFLRKGSQVYIEGALRTRKYTDKNGIERYATEIVASEMQMLGSRGGQGGGGYAPGGDSYDQRAPQQSGSQDHFSNAAPAAAPAPAQNANSGGAGFDNFDDDIPF